MRQQKNKRRASSTKRFSGEGAREVSGSRPSPSASLTARGGRGFFQRREVDLEGAWSAHREKYKGKLGVNARAAVQKKGEACSSFSSLLLSYLILSYLIFLG